MITAGIAAAAVVGLAMFGWGVAMVSRDWASTQNARTKAKQ